MRRKTAHTTNGAGAPDRRNRAGGVTRIGTVTDPGLGRSLAAWGIPFDFPCRLIAMPTRISEFCARLGLDSIGGLLNTWTGLGPDGFKAEPQLGLVSVAWVERFADCLRRMDLRAASRFLPLDAQAGRPTLAGSLALMASRLSEARRTMLERRLVDGMSGATSARTSGVSRQAVHLYQQRFLGEVGAALDHFAEDHARLLGAWLVRGDLRNDPALLELGRDREFMAAALDRVFRTTRLGAELARRERSQTDVLLERCFGELTDHPDLWLRGVDLSGFLKDRLPEDKRQEFFERVITTRTLRFHFPDGRVRPAQACLRKTVDAILVGRKGRVALSRVIRLVDKSGSHPSLPPETYRRQSVIWQRDHGFRTDRIIWNR